MLKSCLVALIIILWNINIFGRINENLGFGFNIGAQRLYGEGYIRPILDLGGESFLCYRFPDTRYGLITSLGMSWLKGWVKLPAVSKRKISTNLINLDLKGIIWFLPGKKFSPTAMIGIGIFNASHPLKKGMRYFDGAFIIGGGFDWHLHTKIAFNTMLDYRYTTGDLLDGYASGVTDGYLSGRIGFTYYFKSKIPTQTLDLVDSELIVDEQPSADEVGKSNQVQNLSDHSLQDFIALRSKLEELKELIAKKESQILEFKTLIESKKQYINELEQRGVAQPTPINLEQKFESSGNFAADYENALEKIYAREHDSAIAIFLNLLQSHPNHHLSSNCQYWIGEAYFAKGELKAAIDAFEQVLVYAESPKMDDALLMLGKCYFKMGDYANAKKLFRQLIDQHPESEYLDKADSFLEQM